MMPVRQPPSGTSGGGAGCIDSYRAKVVSVRKTVMAVVVLVALAAAAAFAATVMRADTQPQASSDLFAVSSPGWTTVDEGVIRDSSWRYEEHRERNCWRVVVFDGGGEAVQQVAQPRGVAGCAPDSRPPDDPAAEARRLIER